MATYSFQTVQATLSGVGAIINLGQGAAVAEEGITIEMSGDKNTMTVGADGEGMHSLHRDRSGTITVRLLKTSPVNAQLMVLYASQSEAPTAWGQNTITVTNTASGDVHTGEQCAFKKKPNMTYAKEGDIIEWQWEAIKVFSTIGVYL
jgi:Protein of unknown function (DUF3277)